MSKKRDYTRYSKSPVDSMDTVNPAETVTEDVTPVEVEPETTTEVEQKSQAEEPKFVTGIVTDCAKLNVREDPDSTASILGTITASTELIVNKEESTEDYYKICTSVGLEGYCLKRYITIMP